MELWGDSGLVPTWEIKDKSLQPTSWSTSRAEAWPRDDWHPEAMASRPIASKSREGGRESTQQLKPLPAARWRRVSRGSTSSAAGPERRQNQRVETRLHHAAEMWQGHLGGVLEPTEPPFLGLLCFIISGWHAAKASGSLLAQYFDKIGVFPDILKAGFSPRPPPTRTGTPDLTWPTRAVRAAQLQIPGTASQNHHAPEAVPSSSCLPAGPLRPGVCRLCCLT